MGREHEHAKGAVQVTKADVPEYAPATIELPNGWTAEVRTERDEDMGAPWKEHDGHGPVSDWRSIDQYHDKRAGERELHRDGRRARYYDFAEAVRIAKRDGWGCTHGGHKPKNELAACAAEQDFERMRAWCNDGWEWIGVIVEVMDADGGPVESSSLWGIESDTDYWREVAAELINEIAGGAEAMNVTITFTNRNPNTIWNRLASKLGRQPTNTEAKAEVQRILKGIKS